MNTRPSSHGDGTHPLSTAAKTRNRPSLGIRVSIPYRPRALVRRRNDAARIGEQSRDLERGRRGQERAGCRMFQEGIGVYPIVVRSIDVHHPPTTSLGGGIIRRWVRRVARSVETTNSRKSTVS